jgi:hypothetical protein
MISCCVIYQKWTFPQTSISVEYKWGPLPNMQGHHFWYASFVGINYCYGCTWVHNCSGLNQAPWEGEWWVGSEVALPNKQFETMYQNHWTLSTKYLGVVLPCPHHPRASGGSIVANSIAYSESGRGKLHFPLDG